MTLSLSGSLQYETPRLTFMSHAHTQTHRLCREFTFHPQKYINKIAGVTKLSQLIPVCPGLSQFQLWKSGVLETTLPPQSQAIEMVGYPQNNQNQNPVWMTLCAIQPVLQSRCSLLVIAMMCDKEGRCDTTNHQVRTTTECVIWNPHNSCER